MTHGIEVGAPLIASYKNGNYNVELYGDGTKIRFADVDEFVADFPENIDVCLTKKCDGGCPWCYEGCTVNGKHGMVGLMSEEYDEFVLPKWMMSLRPGTELALNGNDLSHPHLEDCLKVLRNRGIITNMTINQRHLVSHLPTLVDWQERELIHGIGISLSDSTDEYLYMAIETLNNVVLHVINGLFTVEDIMNLQSIAPKVLILGYKDVGRGTTYHNTNQSTIAENMTNLRANLRDMVFFGWVSGVSFDNLALEQLDVKNTLFNGNEERWSRFYMGDDGSFTMYIDTVNGKFSKNSCMPESERFEIGDKTVDEMFNFIRERYNK